MASTVANGAEAAHVRGNTLVVITAILTIARKLRRGAFCVVVISASALLGCSSARNASVSVTPESSLRDQPVHIA